MNSQNIKVIIVNDIPKSRNILQSIITDYYNDVTIVGQANSIEMEHF